MRLAIDIKTRINFDAEIIPHLPCCGVPFFRETVIRHFRTHHCA